MMQNNDDETAFPVAIGQTAADMKGLSMRDWFAGKVIQGIYADSEMRGDCAKFAQMAYKQADAMMEVRKEVG